MGGLVERSVEFAKQVRLDDRNQWDAPSALAISRRALSRRWDGRKKYRDEAAGAFGPAKIDTDEFRSHLTASTTW